MDCPGCGHGNRDGREFCGQCGASLAVSCPSCGAVDQDGERFCGGCGTELRASTGTSGAPLREPLSYTPKHLADKILTSRSALEGERKQVTVLFADMKGSTELTARLDPEEWHAIMDGFLGILAGAVHHFEGTVNQYTGDGIMALFGAPIAHEDHAQRACYAALRLRNELRRHADGLRIERGLSFAVRVGLHSGEVVVGKIGDDLRMDYTARGHSVHLASRMEEIAEPGTIYLSGATASLVEGYFELRDLGSASVKGIEEPVQVSELVGAGELQTRFDLSRARGLTPFVGRDPEMKQLEAALERARRGEAPIVGVVAEAGSGKSRLCWEFANRCRELGIRPYTVTCPPYGKSIPLSLYRNLLRAHFDVSEGESDEVARNTVAGKMARQDPDLAASIPFVLDFLGVAEPGNEAPAIDADTRARELQRVVGCLFASAPDRPVVEIADDLHWIDSASAVAHFKLQESLDGVPHLTVLNYRPDHRPLEAERVDFEELRLEPLSAESTAELLADLLGPEASGLGLEERIQARAAGNPFFVEEIVRSLADSGHLEGTRSAYRLVEPVESIDVPESVRAVLAARIDKLGQRAKRTLQAAAVLGKSFRSRLLAEALGHERADVDEVLHALASSEFVVLEVAQPDEVWAFKHPLSQEVAYETLLRATRKRIHSGVARVLAAAQPTDSEPLALLAYHWEGAEKPIEAARCHRLASPDYADMSATYDHALRVRELLSGVRQTTETRRLRLWALSRILSWGMFRDTSLEEVRETLDEARALVRSPADRTELATLLAGAAGVANVSGDSELARSLATEAVALADRGEDLMAQLFARLRVTESTRVIGDELRELEAAIAFANERITDEPAPHAMLGTLVLWRERARALYSGLGNVGHDLAEAEGHMALFGGPMATMMVEKVRAELEVMRGNGAGALRHATRVLESARQVGTPLHISDAWGALANALLLGEQYTEAAEAAERAHAEASSTHARSRIRAPLLALLARARLGLGDSEHALTAAQQAVERAEESDLRVGGIPCYLAHANVLLGASGTRARAKILRALARAEELIEFSNAYAFTPHVHLARARLAELQGKKKERELELREAHRLFVETGATGHAERVAQQLA